MKRKIIKINEDKCNGCGLCADACHEGAIELVDGKARLVSDKYCDGLGDCLPACPTGAIDIIKREAEAYDEEAVKAKKDGVQQKLPCGCPGTLSQRIEKPGKGHNMCKPKETKHQPDPCTSSELVNWPVQLKLVNPGAEYLENSNLLVAADCTAFAYAGFHRDFIKGHVTLVGCPKLDDNDYYTEKLAEILARNNIKSITVVIMEVPCCGGMKKAVRDAMLKSQTIVPYNEVIIGINGEIKI